MNDRRWEKFDDTIDSVLDEETPRLPTSQPSLSF